MTNFKVGDIWKVCGDYYKIVSVDPFEYYWVDEDFNFLEKGLLSAHFMSKYTSHEGGVFIKNVSKKANFISLYEKLQ